MRRQKTVGSNAKSWKATKTEGEIEDDDEKQLKSKVIGIKNKSISNHQEHDIKQPKNIGMGPVQQIEDASWLTLPIKQWSKV